VLLVAVAGVITINFANVTALYLQEKLGAKEVLLSFLILYFVSSFVTKKKVNVLTPDPNIAGTVHNSIPGLVECMQFD